MRVLTVQQPWAWAIVAGGKDVENRTQVWKYRGPLAIHAGMRDSERGFETIPGIIGRGIPPLTYGAIIGVVDLVDVHIAQPDWIDRMRTACCESPWGESQYDEHGGKTRRDITHLVLANPRAFTEPIPCKGRLGLWTPTPELAHELADAR